MTRRMRVIQLPSRGAAGGPRLHECTICGKVEPWGRGWAWYGSPQDEEDGTIPVNVCSTGCKAKARERRLAP